jgi:Ca2+/Na+ antiporter
MLKKKQKDITSPTATDSENPLRDFVVLLSIIITTPFIFLFSLFTGRIRNPFIVVAFLLLAITGLYYLSKSEVVSKKHIKAKIIQQTLEELTPEDKEELRKTISTLRKSIDVEKLPKPLEPLLDVPVDMLSINYLLFMLQSGYIQPDGAGSEFILDSYLHSKHKMLREKSWEALMNINTEQAKRVMSNYEAEVARKKAAFKKKYGNKPQTSGMIEDLQEDIKNKILDLKH